MSEVIIFVGMMVNFVGQLGWAKVPRYLVKHHAARVVWDEIYI